MRVLVKHSTGSKANRIEQFSINSSEDISLGRDPAAMVTYDPKKDDLVSRRHALIRTKKNGKLLFTIEDLQSRNGTFVNGERLTGERELLPGDVVELSSGGPKFTFDVEPRPPHLMARTTMKHGEEHPAAPPGAGDTAASRDRPQPRADLPRQARRQAQPDPQTRSPFSPILKCKTAVATSASGGKWTIAAAAMMVGIGILALMEPSSLPVAPADPAVDRAKVLIQDYGEHYQLYRGDELLGTTPFEFEANVGERIQVECRSNGEHVQTLTFDVGNNNVWSCRE